MPLARLMMLWGVILTTASLFAYQYKKTQIGFLSADVFSYYPASFLLRDMCFIVLLLVAIWWLVAKTYQWLFPSQKRLKNLIWAAVPSVVLAASIVGLPVQRVIQLFLIGHLILALVRLVVIGPRGWNPTLRYHLMAFVLIVMAHAGFLTTISPEVWDKPMMAFARYEAATLPFDTLYRAAYLGAKRLDFSSYNHAYWGSAQRHMPFPHSVLIPFLGLVLDVPAVDPVAFFLLVVKLLFYFSAIGAFGFYLFVFRGLRLTYPVSVIGGLFFLCMNPFFARGLTKYMNLFVAIYLTLPFALLAIRTAFRRKSLLYAFLAGFLVSLSRYVFYTHIDSVLHGIMFLGFYTVLLFMFNREIPSIKRRAAMLVLPAVGYLCGSAYYIVPLVTALITGEYGILGHQESSYEIMLSAKGMLPLFTQTIELYGPVLFLLPFAIMGILRNKRFGPDLKAFLILFVALSVCLLPGKEGPFAQLMAEVFPVLKFQYVYRMGYYYILLALLISLFVLHELSETHQSKGLRYTFLVWGCWLALMGAIPLSLFFIFEEIGLKETISSVAGTGTLYYVPLLLIFLYWPKLEGRFQIGLRTLVMVALAFVVIRRSPAPNQFLPSFRFYQEDEGRPYVSLRSLLTSYKNLGFEDTASLALIGNRLCEYQKEVMRQGKRALPGLNEACHSGVRLLETADRLAYSIDQWNLEQKGPWYPKAYDHKAAVRVPQTPDFANGDLLMGLKNRYQQVMYALGEGDLMPQIGVTPGVFIHNGEPSTDFRYANAFPPVSALYVSPGSDRLEAGFVSDRILMNAKLEHVTGSFNRKMMNIAGIDVFIFKQDAFEKLADKSEYKILDYKLPERVMKPYLVVQDQRSYGVAYVASSLQSDAPRFEKLKAFVPPFLGGSQRHHRYVKEIERSWNRLYSMTGSRETILERPIEAKALRGKGKVEMVSIQGNRAAFRVQCDTPVCQMVYNRAFLPGWFGFRAGKSLKLERANYAFVSAMLPRGEHLVWLEYRPWLVEFGKFIVLLGFCVPLCNSIKFPRSVRVSPVTQPKPVPSEVIA